MCPNYDVLSAFFDGELSPSQQAKITEHTKNCSACQERLMSFRLIKDYLHKAKDTSWPGPEEKIWERLTISRKEVKQKQEKKFFFWQKQILLPLPILILGGISFFITLGFLFIIFLRPEQAGERPADSRWNNTSIKQPVSLKKIEQNIPVQTRTPLPGGNVNASLAKFEKANQGKAFTLELPERVRFTTSPEPVFILSQPMPNR